jgi:anti-sigma factor RsiW
MDCRDAHRFVQLRLDDEIEPTDCAQLDQHLAACVPCRSRVEREQRFELELRNHMRSAAAHVSPPALRERILGELSAADSRTQPVWSRVAIAASSVLVVLGVSWSATRDGPDLLRESVRRHSVNLPPDVRSVSGPVEVDRYLRQKLTYPVSVPRLDQSGLPVRLVGARLSNIHDQDVALVMYDHRGAKLSLFAYPIGPQDGVLPQGFERRQVGGRELMVGAERGYNVVAWRDRGTFYSLVSDVDPSELVQLAAAVR